MVACAVIQFSTSDGFDAPCAGGRARVLVARNAVELQCNQPGTGVRGRVLRPDVHRTGGNRSSLTGYRSNRSGPVSIWAGIKSVQIQNLNLNSKK